MYDIAKSNLAQLKKYREKYKAELAAKSERLLTDGMAEDYEFFFKELDAAISKQEAIVNKLAPAVKIASVLIPDQFSVLWECRLGRHVITYGKQIEVFRSDSELAACHEFGECVRHAAKCAGKLD